MKRQKARKLILILSLLLFPITLYYFSPVLVMNASLHGIVCGSMIVFGVMFLVSTLFGRLFCAYLCPAGGLQECAFSVNDKKPKQRWRNAVKYVIWSVWMLAVVGCCVKGGGFTSVDFFFETEHGVSVVSLFSYIIYYGIVCLIFLPSILFGRRAFCHYFCWMAPFMVLGTRLGRLLRFPGLHIRVQDKEKCVSCGRCEAVCPMGVDVRKWLKGGSIQSAECINCGACVDHCLKGVLAYAMKREG